MNKQVVDAANTLREAEEAGYHAFREWIVFLILRHKELVAHRSPDAAQAASDTKSK